MMQQHNQYSQQLQHASSSTKTKQHQSSPTAAASTAQATLSLLHSQQQAAFIGQSHLRKLANATFTIKGGAAPQGGGATNALLLGTAATASSGLTQAQMMMASKLVNAGIQAQLHTHEEGAAQSQSYRQTFQNTGLIGGGNGNDFCAENASSSTKSIPVGKKQQPTYSNVNIISGRRAAGINQQEYQTGSGQKKKAPQSQTVSGGLALKIGKKQGLTLSSAAVSTSAQTGKTTGPQTTTHGNHVKSMKTTGAIMSSGSGARDLSANSDKAGNQASTVQNPPGLSNSLLKQKSRNRCNENLNIGGAAGTGSGVAVGGQGTESHGSRGHINNTHSNIETAYQSHAHILSSGLPGSGLLKTASPLLGQESSSLGDLKPSGANLAGMISSGGAAGGYLGVSSAHKNKNIHEKESIYSNNNPHSNINSSQRAQQLLLKNPENTYKVKVDLIDTKNQGTLSLDRGVGQTSLNQTVKGAGLASLLNSVSLSSANANQNSLDTSVGNIAQFIPKKKIILQNTTQEKIVLCKNLLGVKLLTGGEKNSTPTYHTSTHAVGGFSQTLEKAGLGHCETLSVDEQSSLSNRGVPVNQQQVYEQSPTMNQKPRQVSRINHQKLIKQVNPEYPQKNAQNTSSHAVNVFISDSQGLFLQSERAAYLGSKLSLSHEYANSARECEMSTTINYTNATGMNLHQEEALVSQTMMVQSQSPGEGSACSPQNQSTGKINFYPASKNSSGILKRRTPASSQHIVNQHAPNQAKRKNQVKAESCHQRVGSDDADASSPSAREQNTNNVSSSQGNKSQHYGLSSQSFLTNSNSNGGSNTRVPGGVQGQEPAMQNPNGGPSSSCVNTSSLSSSFFTHQRQKSGGGFTTALSNIKTSTKKTNSSLQPQGTQNIGKNTLQGSNIVFRGGNQLGSTKKAILGQHDTDMKATKSIHHATLSQTKIEVNQPLSLSSRPVYNDHLESLQPTTSGQVMLKNVSKSGLKLEISKRGENTSRSNSFRKVNQAIIKSGSKITLNKNSVSSLVHQSDNHQVMMEPSSPTNAANLSSENPLPNRHVYNHTVEDLDNVDSLDHSILHASFSKQAQPPSTQSSNLKQQMTKAKYQQKVIQGYLNRSVVVEASSSQMNNSLIKLMKKKPGDTSGAKAAAKGTSNNNIKEYEIFDIMKNELKSKDMMIQNLRDRLVDLEEKVSGIEQNQERNGRNRGDEVEDEESQRARDKSQQRIKEAIINLERKLEQFRLDKELNNLRLEELKQYSSSQHSSSRQSDMLHGQRSLQTQQQYLQSMLDSGLIPNLGSLALVQGRTPQYNIPTTSSNDGGFASHTLGAPRRRQQSRASLIEDLESLITIPENEESLAAVGGGANLVALQNQLFYEHRGSQGLLNVDPKSRLKNFNKIKTPMFEDDIAKLCQSSSDDDQVNDSHLKIIAQGGDLILDEDGQDNSCLLMLEKEWQEAQQQKLREEEGLHPSNFLNGSGGANQNISNLFDQSLISSSNNAMQPKTNNNNRTQKNIVFFFDEDDTMQQEAEDDEDIERYVEQPDDFAQLAKVGNEKFVKTQKIEFSQKERASLIAAGARRTAAFEKGDSSLSPSSHNGNGQIPIKKLKLHAKVEISTIEGQPTFSRTLSKTQLLEKIRNAIGKQDNRLVSVQPKKASPTRKPNQQQPQASTAGPRRFIVKRSQERNASTSQNAQLQQQPAKLKSQVAVQKTGRPEHSVESAQELDKGDSNHHEKSAFQQQEQLMKTIVQQKEKIAQGQKDALKKERELSLQLRQAIQKLNLKTQHVAATGTFKKPNPPKQHQQQQ